MLAIVEIETLTTLMKEALIKSGVNDVQAQCVAKIYKRASYRGVGHHDINDFFSRIERLTDGRINPKAKMKLVTAFGAIEVYDGDNGLGEMCTSEVTSRAIALAKNFGIGYSAVRNSNHFLAAAPYAEMADEEGVLAIVMSKSPSGISLPGADKDIIGNNPFGFAAGYEEGSILLDICSAYSSYGKAKQMAKNGQEVPAYWGNNKEGKPTTDPAEILESGLYMPIGIHKGFGLALMIEMFSAVIGGGDILKCSDKDNPMEGTYTQSVIAIDVSKLMPEETYRDRVRLLVENLKQLYPQIYIPGERSAKVRRKIEAEGTLEVDDEVIERLKRLL